MRIVGNDPTLSRQITATASGAISAAGKPLVVNTDGTVAEAGIDSATQSLGSVVNFEGDAVQYISATFDSNSNRVVIAYRDDNNSNYGTAIVGTISGTSVSYGTAVVFESAETTWINATFDSSNNKVVISYLDAGNSNYGTAIVGTVDSSDNSISFGSATVFNTAATNQGKITFDSSNNKVVIAYNNGGDSGHGYAIVGTVSGTSISFGSAAEFENAVISDPAITFDTDTNKVIIAYRDEGNSNYGTAIVGTVSGTSISFGSPTVYQSANASETAIAYDSNAQRIIVAYTNGGDGDHGYAAVGTVSGTGFSGFGTPVEFRNADLRYNSIVFDSNANKVVVIWREDDDSNKGKFVIGTVATSGNTVTFDATTLTTFESSNGVAWTSSVFDSSNNKVLIAWHLYPIGKSAILQVGFSNEKLTTENFIGTSAHSAADGAKVLVNTQGAIDENQSGLTAGQTFFVDKNGDLQLTTNITQGAGTPAVFASGSMLDGDILFDPDSGKMILAYYDSASAKGRYIVATISGTDVTFGTAGQIGSNEYVYYASLAYDTNSDRVVLFYMDANNYAKAIVGTVSGTTISWGSPVTVKEDSTAWHQAIFDPDTNKIVVAFRDQNQVASGNGAKAAVGTVDPSDNSISFGSLVAFDGGMVYSDIAYDTTNNKVVIAYSDEGNSNYGTAIVGTVSGTSISFGTAVVWRSDGANLTEMSFDSNESRVVIAHRGPNSPDNGRAIVGTVSGTSISFGSAADFDSSASQDIAIAFDSNVNKHLIIYRDANNSNYFTGIIGTVSGTSISFGSSFLLNGNNVGRYGYVDFDTTQNKFLIGFRDEGDSNKAKAVVFQNANDLSGSLSADAVTAGTALSATKLLVKG